jgi:hypothetical protein
MRVVLFSIITWADFFGERFASALAGRRVPTERVW